MDYVLEVTPSCKESIDKACRKNPVLRKAISNKTKEILRNPDHYKHLRGEFAGEQRVHILKSFVLRFTVNKNTRTVCLLAFDHHDNVYE